MAVHPFVSAPNCVFVTPSMGILFTLLAYLALKCSKLAANSVCTITYHDIEKPEELKKLRNF